MRRDLSSARGGPGPHSGLRALRPPFLTGGKSMNRPLVRAALGVVGWSVGIAVLAQCSAATAIYDAALHAPKCGAVSCSCDSGPSLLLGRDGRGPEPHASNTIAASCADGTSGVFHVDESNDRLRVLTIDNTGFAPGKTVKIEATVWAWTTPSSDHLDLYAASDATNPSWTLLTTMTPTVVGAQT